MNDSDNGKLSVLFVDDEQNVLDGLRRMLRGQRRKWAMDFIACPVSALERIEQQHFDVVVSDLRMPRMKGDQFLDRVRQINPDAIRIVLSGEADKTSILTTVEAAHQFLAKPCNAEDLQSTIFRASTMRRVLANEEIKAAVGRLDRIPSLPAIFEELQDILQEPDVPIERVADIIATDAGMSAQILKLVNSAFFGMRRRVDDIRQGVSLLGLETLNSLILSKKAFSAVSDREVGGIDIETLANHNMRTAAHARRIASLLEQDRAMQECCFVAGLMHDLGKLILGTELSDTYSKLAASAKRHGVPLHLAEDRVLQVDHGEVGAYLLSLWGLSDPIIEAVCKHHRPRDDSSQGFTPLLAVHIADAMDERVGAAETAEIRLDVEHIDGVLGAGTCQRISEEMDAMPDESGLRQS